MLTMLSKSTGIKKMTIVHACVSALSTVLGRDDSCLCVVFVVVVLCSAGTLLRGTLHEGQIPGAERVQGHHGEWFTFVGPDAVPSNHRVPMATTAASPSWPTRPQTSPSRYVTQPHECSPASYALLFCGEPPCDRSGNGQGRFGQQQQ
jgi:hypothetical protein